MTTGATDSRDGRHRVSLRLEFRLGEDDLAAAVALEEQFDPRRQYRYGTDWVRSVVEREIYAHGMFASLEWAGVKDDYQDAQFRYEAALALVRRVYKFPMEGDERR